MDPTDWLPTYPDLPIRMPRRRESSVADLAYSAEAFPVPDVLAGLTFLPLFPDRVPHLRILRELAQDAWPGEEVSLIFPLVWLGDFPDQVPHRRLPWGAHLPAEAPPGAGVVVAQSLAWQAQYPSGVPHRFPPNLGGLVWTIAPSLLGAPCVHLGLETTATTAFLAEALTLPALLEEGLGSPALIEEDLC